MHRQNATIWHERPVWIALGCNDRGAWGAPEQALATAILKMRASGLEIKIISDVYVTAAIGGGRQPDYLNAVIGVRSHLAPAALLRLLKRLERQAGRRLGRHWGPRPLDLDIVAFGPANGRSGAGPRRQGQVILPHPEMHRRAFVLVPLAQVAPFWWHPVLHRSVRQLLEGEAVRRQRRGVRRLMPLAHILPSQVLDEALSLPSTNAGKVGWQP